MSDTNEVLAAARKLGQLIGEHPAASGLAEVEGEFEKDIDTQRLITDFDRLAETIARKESEGKAIEVDEKRKMEELRFKVAQNGLIRKMQGAQMDYMDLMRQVNQAIAPGGGAGPEAMG